MVKYNRFLLYLFLMGNIAIFIGSTQKLYENVNFAYAIYTGLLINLFVVTLFVYHNFTHIKIFLKSLFVGSH